MKRWVRRIRRKQGGMSKLIKTKIGEHEVHVDQKTLENIEKTKLPLVFH